MTDAAERFAAELLRLKAERNLSYRVLAEVTTYSASYLEELAKGKKPPNAAIAMRLDEMLGTGRRFTEILRPAEEDDADAELDAIELVSGSAGRSTPTLGRTASRWCGSPGASARST